MSGRLLRIVRRPSAGVAAILLLTAANACLVRGTGCASNSQFALVRAIGGHGQLAIDRYQWQTCDKSYSGDHFYSNKAPGLAFVAAPVYGALHLAGLVGEHPPSVDSVRANGDDLSGPTWSSVLVGAVLPVLLLLLLVRRLGDELAPGYGTATAMTLGLATLVLPFSSVFFQHALSATLGFAAFAVLWIERRGPPRLGLVAAGGVVAAYAASVEYPLALLTVVLGLYALARSGRRVLRGAFYSAGALVGIAPLLLYDRLAFGGVRHLSYAYQVRNQGQTGHDDLGGQSRGLYGVTTPRVHQGLSLLIGTKGLLVLGPVVALSVVGIVLLWRRGFRAEALVCAAVPVGFVGYNSGFPIGGDVPGPRYLIPMLPFLVLPIALVWRRAPLTTLVLAAGSAVSMVAATVTGARWGSLTSITPWFTAIAHGHMTGTLLSLAGAGHGWVALLPWILLAAGSVVLAARATPRLALARGDAELAVGSAAGWLLVAGAGPLLLRNAGTSADPAAVLLVAAVAGVVWAVSEQGLRALAVGAPLLLLTAPGLAKRPGVVAAVAAGTLVLVGAVQLSRPRLRRLRARLARAAGPLRDLPPARAGLLAIGLLMLANAYLLQRLGANQTSHYALVRALAHGTPVIDPYQQETVDKAWFHGHFYANKAPGLAFLTLPFYELEHVTHTLSGNPRVALWTFGLLWVVGASTVLLLLVRRLAERVEPGYGSLAAVMLGLSTLLLPFASLFFAHALSALLVLAAFALLWHERAGPERLGLVAVAGLVMGAAVVVEYPNGLEAAILLVYAAAVRGGWARRAAAYLGGAAVGALPVLAYNRWAYGSFTHSTYDDVVFVSGRTGHDVVGSLHGFFGITTPDPRVALALLVAPKGVLVLTPVLAAAVAGLPLLWRRGHRAEVGVIVAIGLACMVYSSGFFVPFGGDGPGPRYLIQVLPLLGLPLAIACRRWPVTTGTLAALSAVAMIGATTTEPLLGTDDTGLWVHRFLHGDFTNTVLTYLGGGHGWVSIVPFLLLVLAAAACAARSAPRPVVARADAAAAAASVAGWAILATTGHRLLRTGGQYGLPHSTSGAALEALIVAAVIGTVCLIASGAGSTLARDVRDEPTP